jgi:hypothetical protein
LQIDQNGHRQKVLRNVHPLANGRLGYSWPPSAAAAIYRKHIDPTTQIALFKETVV